MLPPTTEERGVGNEVRKKKWTKPKLKLIGEIKDVAGTQTPLSQAVNAKS